MTVDVSVLIVTWNSEGTIADCLRSVEQAGHSLRLDVIVADNGSGDGTARLVARDFPGVQLLPLDGAAGFAGANNRALSHADPSAQYVLLLNPDATLGAGCLETLCACLDAPGTNRGACGPVLVNTDGTLQQSWGRFPTLISELSGRIDRKDSAGALLPRSLAGVRELAHPRRVDWLGGACLLVSREALEDVQGPLLDPMFPLYSEEVDLCVRLRAAGFGVYLVPGAECVHAGGASSSQTRGRALGLLFTSKVRLFRKHWPRRARLLHVGLTILAAVKSVWFRGERGRAYREAWRTLRTMGP